MPFKNAVLVLLFCSVFQSAVSTEFLLNMVKNARCKLHKIGSSIIPHSHYYGDPCGSQDRDNGQYGGHGNNQFGYQNGYTVPRYDQNSYQYGAIPECSQNTDCPLNEACIRYKCVNPCPGFCGINAECKVRYHVPSCSCIPGSTGDAYIQCHSTVRPVEIIPQCIFNKHCPQNQACLQSKCADPCIGTCGINAECEVVDHSPFCSCITGYTGDPLLQCYARAAKSLDADPDFFSEMVIGDETWVHHWDLETKLEFMQWVHKASSPPKKAHTHCSDRTPMATKAEVIFVEYMSKGSAITAVTYVNKSNQQHEEGSFNGQNSGDFVQEVKHL